MFTSIVEYMKQSREERRLHLVLTDQCIEIGGGSKEFRGLLAHRLRTTLPTGMKTVLCHACNNAGCSNTSHLYWGSAKDNTQDQIENGTFRSIHDRAIEKYGEAEYLSRLSAQLIKGRDKSLETNQLNEEDLRKIASVLSTVPEGRGRIQKLSNLLGVSHTQIRRYILRLERSVGD